jgi:hypothetical protein
MPPARDRIFFAKGFPTGKGAHGPTKGNVRFNCRKGAAGGGVNKKKTDSKVQTMAAMQGPNDKHQITNKDQTAK